MHMARSSNKSPSREIRGFRARGRVWRGGMVVWMVVVVDQVVRSGRVGCGGRTGMVTVAMRRDYRSSNGIRQHVSVVDRPQQEEARWLPARLEWPRRCEMGRLLTWERRRSRCCPI